MAGAGLKALVVVVVLVLVALVIDFNFLGSSLTDQFRFNYPSPLVTGVADETTPTNNTTTPGPPFSLLSLSFFAPPTRTAPRARR
jgi:hypothetical protein